jgi:hypothetical protein
LEPKQWLEWLLDIKKKVCGMLNGKIQLCIVCPHPDFEGAEHYAHSQWTIYEVDVEGLLRISLRLCRKEGKKRR